MMTEARQDRTSISVALTALGFVSTATAVFLWCDAQPWRWMDSGVYSGVLRILLWVVPAVLLVMARHRVTLGGAVSALGLEGQPLAASVFACIATAPMGAAALFSGTMPTSFDFVVSAVILGPFAEEVLYRGFLLRELMTRARWPAGWAFAASAVLFGAAHVTNITEPVRWFFVLTFGPGSAADPHAAAGVVPFAFALIGDPLMQAAMPAVGGLVFAWIVYRTGTLWPAVALHAALNFWSVVSRGPAADVVHGADPISIGQGASLVLAVVLVEALRLGRRGHAANAQ